jgi:hypothetical protein
MQSKTHIAYHNFVEKKMSMDAALIDIFSAGYEDGYEAGLAAQEHQKEVNRLTNCLTQIQRDINNDAVAATCQTLGQYRSMLQKIITAYVNTSNSTQLDYKYFVREIGEEDWREVTHSDYEASKPDPRTDYKRVAVVQVTINAPETNTTYIPSGGAK